MSRLVFAALVLLTACKGKDDDGFDFSTIPSGPLEGTVGGEAWSFSSGTTDSFLSDDEDYFAVFYSIEVACDDIMGTRRTRRRHGGHTEHGRTRVNTPPQKLRSKY